jgi:hypothetical protein
MLPVVVNKHFSSVFILLMASDEESLFGEKDNIFPQGLILLKNVLKSKVVLDFQSTNQIMQFGKFDCFKELQNIGIIELEKVGINHKYFDQYILNRYLPGDGINPHVDLDRFEDGVVIGCVLGAATMQFEHVDLKLKYDLYLEENDVLILSKSARYDWTHSIPPTKFDTVNGREIRRRERHSITLRKMKLDSAGIAKINDFC